MLLSPVYFIHMQIAVFMFFVDFVSVFSKSVSVSYFMSAVIYYSFTVVWFHFVYLIIVVFFKMTFVVICYVLEFISANDMASADIH